MCSIRMNIHIRFCPSLTIAAALQNLVYWLCMENDGNLVLYKKPNLWTYTPIW